MRKRVQKSSMGSWPDHSPSGNQKRFWRGLSNRAGALNSAVLDGFPFVRAIA